MGFVDVKGIPFSKFGMGYIVGSYFEDKPFFKFYSPADFVFCEKNLVKMQSYSSTSDDVISKLNVQDDFTIIPTLLKVEDGINYIGYPEKLDDPKELTITPVHAEHVNAPVLPCSTLIIECRCIEKEYRFYTTITGEIIHISAVDSIVDEDGYLFLGGSFGMKDFVNIGREESDT